MTLREGVQPLSLVRVAAVALATLLSASSAPARDAPSGVTLVTPSGTLSDRYLFAPVVIRSGTGRIHVLFGRGDAHYWKGRAGIGHAVSDNEGRSWTESADAVRSEDARVYDRFGSFGVSKSGKLITLFLRVLAPGQKPILYQAESLDDGGSWSAPKPAIVVPGSGAPFKSSFPYPYGAIRRTASGALAAMAYVVEENSALVSKDDGATWTRNLIISSEKPNYSEMGLAIIDEKTWLAVSRLDDQTSQMVQFVTRDSGMTWISQGSVDLPAGNEIYVAPTIDSVKIGGQRGLLLSYCDRRLKTCEFRLGDPSIVTGDAQRWGAPNVFSRGLFGRSGYQSFVPGRDGTSLIGALMLERNADKADIGFFRVSLPSGPRQ